MTGGIPTIVAFTSYFNMMADSFRMLSISWLFVGVILLIVALFGIFAAFKESIVLAKLVK